MIAPLTGTGCGILFFMSLRTIETQIPYAMFLRLLVLHYTGAAAAGIAVYALLTSRLGSTGTHSAQTCCRKCGYILRRISEPRCPECGERI